MVKKNICKCVWLDCTILAPHGKYPNGIRDVARELIREDGILALYRGVTPVMLRAFPANAVSILSLEQKLSFGCFTCLEVAQVFSLSTRKLIS
jgi:hypothetical protein